MKEKPKPKLELEPPTVECPYCRFKSSVSGTWSLEDGRLAFRADADPLTGRGPSLDGCREGRECGEFSGIATTWGQEFSVDGDQYEEMKAIAAKTWEVP